MHTMLSVIHKKHKDRYRMQFCDMNFYSTHQKTFKMWKTKFELLNNTEKLQAWVVGLSCLRRSADWYGGLQTQKILTDTDFIHRLTLETIFADTSVKIPAKISKNLSVFELINQHRIKAIPEACFRSLCLMTNQTYPLQITTGVTAPKELLKLQLNKKRIVSFNEDYESWPETLYSGRDHLGFILHDLIHADHFFADTTNHQGQIGFYKFIDKIINDPVLNKLLCNIKFKEGFEYIISDMNSHPLHLLQTLHSLLYQHSTNDSEAWQTWHQWCACLPLESKDSLALSQLNTNVFNTDMALDIEVLFQKHGQSI